MGIFRKNKLHDVVFLMPVRLAGEKLPKSKVRMLYSDAAGKLYAPLINRSVYEIAREDAARMGRRHNKSFATLGLETAPGRFVPTVVEIGPREVWALEHILEHALKSGRLPDVLKRYLKPIIKLGEAGREAVIADYRRGRRLPAAATPPVLHRLPYYAERDMEFSMPIYKAAYNYPLTVLKRLAPDERDSQRTRRLLILDSDGDAAVIEVLLKLADDMEKELREQQLKNKGNVCAIVLQGPEGMSVDYLKISRLQRKALDTIIRYFEATGAGKQPISAAARKVLSRARDRVSSVAGEEVY